MYIISVFLLISIVLTSINKPNQKLGYYHFMELVL